MSLLAHDYKARCKKCANSECDIEIVDFNDLYLEITVQCVECDTIRYETYYPESLYNMES